jgi:hypothetical protein
MRSLLKSRSEGYLRAYLGAYLGAWFAETVLKFSNIPVCIGYEIGETAWRMYIENAEYSVD